jgi:hypothetical protein
MEGNKLADTEKTGGPAFPTKLPAVDPRSAGFYMIEGMQLVDHFAAQALVALLDEKVATVVGRRNLAVAAYDIADQMLAERKARYGL